MASGGRGTTHSTCYTEPESWRVGEMRQKRHVLVTLSGKVVVRTGRGLGPTQVLVEQVPPLRRVQHPKEPLLSSLHIARDPIGSGKPGIWAVGCGTPCKQGTFLASKSPGRKHKFHKLFFLLVTFINKLLTTIFFVPRKELNCGEEKMHK